mgnify:FL=1
MLKVLNKINEPKDLKELSMEELNTLAEEIREGLFNRLTKIGGHFGPNFGFVEATIALHYVFNSPVDKFVFDVSHQTYPHKMLTGRKAGYIEEEHFHDVSGYSNPEESEHDFFTIGHTSTSISLASGLAKARDLKEDKENIIAVIGDGSLSGGEALEGLDFAGSELNSNFIIVVNDNQQSIAENHGGLYKNLKELRDGNGVAKTNIFTAMGLDYIYEKEGNNIEKLIEVFKKVKDIDHPIVVHINTQKGKGYKLAEENKENWHWALPFNKDTGIPSIDFGNGENYLSLTSDLLLEKMQNDKTVVAVAAGVPTSFGFTKEKREKAGKQFVDVGIAEEHAVAMISGIAKNGGKPVFGTNATFIQRTYDQVSQDLCINNNPATILLGYTSVTGLNDVTHLGIFAISAFKNIPNLVILAPTNKKEYMTMLNWSIEQKEHPVMILIPGNGVIDDERDTETDYTNSINKYKIEQLGEKVAIIPAGDFYQIGEKAVKLIEEKLGFKPTLINPRFLTGVDKEKLDSLKANHELIITLEDGIVSGGFGEMISNFYGLDNIKVKNLGMNKEFYDRYDQNELLENLGLTPEKIEKSVEELLK